MNKRIIPCLYLKDGKAVSSFGSEELFEGGDPAALARYYGDSGADELLVFDFSTDDASHEQSLAVIKKICSTCEIPVIGCGNIKRMEDVKKLIYAGCAKTVLNFSKPDMPSLLEEVSKRFGKEKMAVSISKAEQYTDNKECIDSFADEILSLDDTADVLCAEADLPVLVYMDASAKKAMMKAISPEQVSGITGPSVSLRQFDIPDFKEICREKQIPVKIYESSISWKEFKLNSDKMIPVVVQDYKTDEVLMVAYMNEEAFNTTLKTGKMTYWSRSRNELWTKGLTSGHVQYVKSMTLDCDNDTILAKVDQIGAACHTGNRSCFFKPLIKKEYDDTNPLKVFQDVYDVILDRKVHPKEGSYTNYLFDKGIDKILKKVGEECTEIVIAAKNPDKEEIKYEISDFLYHVMVLMAEKDVTWEEITRELARR